MTTFVLIPGAGGAGEVYWREVAAGLAARGHTALPVEICGDDPALGLPEYAAATDAVIGDHGDVVLVAQSMGGFTAPMIGKLDQVARIVLVNAMIPEPGETPGQWFEAVGQQAAFEAAAAAAGRAPGFDLDTVFLHDVPDDVRATMAEGDREPADTPFAQPCAFEAWPDVPIHVLVGADDRLFPADLQVEVAAKRLGVTADVVPGGHLVAKSRPAAVVDALLGYAADPVAFTLDAAADGMRRVVAGVRDDQLDTASPCEAWTVRELVQHVCVLVRVFTGVARHEAPGDRSPVPLASGWREQLDPDLDALVAAWREPSAWQGEAEAGGMTMASTDLAVVVLDELVLHGWDLARATGQEFHASEHDVAVAAGFAAAMSTAETVGSRGGLFGPVVPAPTDAAPLESLLALAGRDPAWSRS